MFLLLFVSSRGDLIGLGVNERNLHEARPRASRAKRFPEQKKRAFAVRVRLRCAQIDPKIRSRCAHFDPTNNTMDLFKMVFWFMFDQ